MVFDGVICPTGIKVHECNSSDGTKLTLINVPWHGYGTHTMTVNEHSRHPASDSEWIKIRDW